MGEYAVIRFLVDESFSEIPVSWICPGRKECWWPKTKNVANLMARNALPDKENWEKHDIEMIAFSSSLEGARKKAVDSEYYTTSDEGSRGRGKRLKKPKNFSSSSDEENEAHTPPPALKKKPSIVTYPLTNQTNHTPPSAPKITPSRENYSLSKQTSDHLKSRRHAGQDISHHSDHERSNSEHFISSDTTQENNFVEENDDITLISKENISQAEEISSMSENIKKILSICKGTLLEVRSINERLSKIESTENAPKVDVSGIVSDKLPCKSLQDIEHLENLLKEKEFKESFTVFVKNIGGRNAKDHTNRSLQRIFTNALGRQCSWLGYRNNFKMKDLQSIRILIGVITSKLLLSESDVEMQISEWFRLSKLRHQREPRRHTISIRYLMDSPISTEYPVHEIYLMDVH